MSTNVVPFDQGRPPAVFANHVSTITEDAMSGIPDSFAVISIRGKNWRAKYQGEEELIRGADGSPMQKLPVVIIGAAPGIAKQWYASAYTEGSDQAPDCYSTDGRAPDPASPKKQCETCEICPKNRFETRVTDDGRTTKSKACQDSKRIAVVPLGDIANEVYGGPMMLRLPPSSLQGFKQYLRMLTQKGAKVEQVATVLEFNYDVAYPQVTFKALGWLTDEQALQVVGPDGNGGMCAHPVLDRMLRDVGTYNPAEAAVDTLSGGGPAAVFARRQDEPAEQPVQPVQQVPAAAAPPAEQPASQPLRHRQAAPAPAVVTQAPADMMSVIDDLLDGSLTA